MSKDKRVSRGMAVRSSGRMRNAINEGLDANIALPRSKELRDSFYKGVERKTRADLKNIEETFSKSKYAKDTLTPNAKKPKAKPLTKSTVNAQQKAVKAKAKVSYKKKK